MINPKVEIRDYLKKLMGRFFYIRNLDDQLKVLRDWQSPKGVEAIEIGAHFFGLLSYSFQRTILIELCMLLSRREQKSLLDFLLKLEEHANTIEPQEYDAHLGRDRTIDADEYKSKVREHKHWLSEKGDLIGRIEARRDKILTHADATYFNNPGDIYTRYPIDIAEIDELLETISAILKTHYCYLFNADLHMTLRTATGIETVLKHVRAYKRIWDDRRLDNLKKYLYTRDDFDDKESIYFNS